MQTDYLTSRHPEPEEMAAYLSGTLPGSSRGELESHLAECRACRTEVTSARRLLREHRVRRRWSVALPAAVAAAVVAYVFVGPLQNGSSKAGSPVREGRVPTFELRPFVRVISPSESESIKPQQVVFTWRKQGADPLYRLTITDPSGAIVLVQETSDTAVTFAEESPLRAGQTYLWYVDALDSNGRSATSGIRRLQTAP
jgi:hypothetical protein